MALVDYLKEGGPKKVHNVDNLLLRESMDVIGAPLCPAVLNCAVHALCLLSGETSHFWRQKIPEHLYWVLLIHDSESRACVMEASRLCRLAWVLHVLSGH
jgi:hypothetical protein